MRVPISVAITPAAEVKLQAIADAEYRSPRAQASVMLLEILDAEPEPGPPGSFDDRDRGLGPDHRLVLRIPGDVARALLESAARNDRSPRQEAVALIAKALNGRAKDR
jgi:hypothetical protein